MKNFSLFLSLLMLLAVLSQAQSPMDAGYRLEGTISATISNCTGLPGNFDFIYGWTCEQPSTPPVPPPSPSVLCDFQQKNVGVKFDPGKLSVKNHSFAVAGYTPCDEDPFIATATFQNNSYSDLTLNNLTINIPSGSFVQATLNGYDLNCTGSVVPVTTLPVIVLHPGECLGIELEVITNGCHFGLLEMPKIEITSTDYCSNTFSCINDLGFLPGSGTSECSDCYRITKTVAPPVATVGEQVTFTILVEGNNAGTNNYLVNIMDNYPVDFIESPAATSWPKTISVPPIGFAPAIVVAGAYNEIVSCTSTPNSINTATIISTGQTANACVEVVCPDIAGCDYFVLQDDVSSGVFGNSNDYKTCAYIAENVTLTVDNQLVLSNLDIYLGSGAQIVVQSNYSLTMDNCNFSSCPYMWRGIKLDPASGLFVTNSSIKDAETAVYANGDAKIEVTDSYIYDCVTGISNATTGNGSTWNLNGFIYGSEIGKVSPILKKEYPGDLTLSIPIPAQPLHGKIGRAGILLNDVLFTIGDNTANPNLFFNINYGIETHNSSLNIYNCAFRDIYADATYANWVINPALKPWGCGVYAKGSDRINFVNVYPLVSGNATIENAPVGIYTNWMNARISRLEMQNVIKGVNSEYSELCSVNVNGCVIHARYRGIDFNENHNAINMSASGNEIYLEPLVHGVKGVACIYMRETQQGNNANYNISDNQHLETISGDAGIVALNVENAWIGYNAIYTSSGTQLPAPGSIGIAINGGGNNAISCNSVTNTIPHSNISTIGMMISVSKNNRIECNQFGTGQSNIWPYTGMWFGGDCDVSNNIAGNSMRDCVTGLYLNSESRIGPQVHRGNVWQNPQIGNAAAINQNSFGFANSEFWVNINSGVQYRPNIVSPPLWFVYSQTGSTYNGCGTQTCIAAIAGGGDGDVEQLKMVARDSAISMDYRDETRNQAQSNLYAFLNEDSLLRVSDSIFQNFYTNKQSLAIGQLQEVNEDLRNAEVYTAQQLATIQLADSLIQLKIDSLYILDSLHRISPVSGYEATRQNIIDRKNILGNTVASIHQQHEVSSGIFRDAAQIKNNPIVPVELPETNQKVVNELLIQYKDNGQESISDNYNSLLAIANQCPFAGGPAVYQARAMLELVDQNVNYNDDAVCLQSGIYRIMQEDVSEAPELFDFKLIPNPASQQITVDLKFANDEAVHFEIRNLLGGIIKEFVIDKGLKSIVFSINNFEQGIYFVRVRKEGVTLNAKRLVIIK